MPKEKPDKMHMSSSTSKTKDPDFQNQATNVSSNKISEQALLKSPVKKPRVIFPYRK